MKTLLLAFTCLCSQAALAQTDDEGQGMPLVFSEDFQSGRDRWVTTDDKSWEVIDEAGKKSFGLNKRISDYQPKVRSPHNIALIQGVKLSDFVLIFKFAAQRTQVDALRYRVGCRTTANYTSQREITLLKYKKYACSRRIYYLNSY